MTQERARRGSPDAFAFEGEGDVASQWLDTAYGAPLRLSGPMGRVQHHRRDFGAVAFDHLRVDASVSWESDAMPALVVVDVLDGDITYSRDGRTDRRHDGDTLLASGWDMPFSGGGDGYETRNTSISGTVLAAAIADIDPERSGAEVRFDSFVPRTAAAGARWRATVDELSQSFPDATSVLAHGEATRLLGQTLLQTFANDVVDRTDRWDADRDQRDATLAVVRVATRLIEARAHEDLSLAELARECRVSPRSLQYAFKNHLGCTPMAYLRRVRLDLARQSLRDGSVTSVSDAAARFGFFNPGRFAADYRQLFDENPRQTLLRGSR